MKRYVLLQIKRMMRMLPFVLAVTAVLLVAVGVIFAGILVADSEKGENKMFSIGVSGDTENDYLKLGMAAMQALDETRFSVSFVEMEESVARQALEAQEISAYIVVPHDFVEKALRGNVEPITFVTTTGADDIVTLFKNEITRLVTDMVIASQKGVYGLRTALAAVDAYNLAGPHMNTMSLGYFDLVLKRSDLLEVQELGISDGLSLVEYYVCGIFLLFLSLMGLPFACLYIRKDASLARFLLSKGYGNGVQLICEYLAHLLAMIAIAALMLVVVGIGVGTVGRELVPDLTVETVLAFGLHGLPVIGMMAAFNMLLFEIASNEVSGVLLHFFTTMGLCYVSGCFYPSYAFPRLMQQIADALPIGVAREQLSAFFTGEDMLLRTVLVLGYGAVFLAAALGLRRLKTVGRRGGEYHAGVA